MIALNFLTEIGPGIVRFSRTNRQPYNGSSRDADWPWSPGGAQPSLAYECMTRDWDDGR